MSVFAFLIQQQDSSELLKWWPILAFLAGLILGAIGMAFRVGKLARVIDEMERAQKELKEEFREMKREFNTHNTDVNRHIEPVRDKQIADSIKGRLDSLEVKIDAIRQDREASATEILRRLQMLIDEDRRKR